jgi:hypothetical protein
VAGEPPDDEPEEVSLLDEEGLERRFLMHDAFDVDELTYYLVQSVEDPEEVLLLKESDDGLEAVQGEELESVLGMMEAEP